MRKQTAGRISSTAKFVDKKWGIHRIDHRKGGEGFAADEISGADVGACGYRDALIEAIGLLRTVMVGEFDTPDHSYYCATTHNTGRDCDCPFGEWLAMHAKFLEGLDDVSG